MVTVRSVINAWDNGRCDLNGGKNKGDFVAVDRHGQVRYPSIASGRDRRGGALRTPSGPKGSSGKEVSPGAVGKPVRAYFYTRKS